MKPRQIFISIEKYVINAIYYSFSFASFCPLICLQNVYTTMHDLKAIYSVILLTQKINTYYILPLIPILNLILFAIYLHFKTVLKF